MATPNFMHVVERHVKWGRKYGCECTLAADGPASSRLRQSGVSRRLKKLDLYIIAQTVFLMLFNGSSGLVTK
jgi:hypothetical protein